MSKELYAKRTVLSLKEKGWHITAAESCTAGLFCATIADISGVSDVLEMGFVTYSEKAKEILTGVDQQTVDKYGVVSEEVAIKMATGSAMKANAEVGVGITGYAGPTGGTEKAPVGTICVGLYVNGNVHCNTFCLDVSKGRNVVREEIVEIALKWLSELL